MSDENRLRKGQVLNWDEMGTLAKERELTWMFRETNGENRMSTFQDDYDGLVASRNRYRKDGMVFEAASYTNGIKAVAAEFGVKADPKDLVMTSEEAEMWDAWQAANSTPDLADDYSSWNKVMQALDEMYQAYNGAVDQYRPHNEVLAELMTAYDEWLD